MKGYNRKMGEPKGSGTFVCNSEQVTSKFFAQHVSESVSMFAWFLNLCFCALSTLPGSFHGLQLHES
jgi:hypothetical protein